MTLVSETAIFSESEWLEIVNELSLPPRQAEVIILAENWLRSDVAM
jgi:hypothetical protein